MSGLGQQRSDVPEPKSSRLVQRHDEGVVFTEGEIFARFPRRDLQTTLVVELLHVDPSVGGRNSVLG